MSYTILYRSLFVKLRSGKYLPIVESGDNNVYEYNNRRRARSWQNAGSLYIFSNRHYDLTADEIMAGIENMINDDKKRYVGQLTDRYDKECTTRYTEEDVERDYSYFSGLTLSSCGNKWASANQIRNFFKRSIENAVDADEVDLVVSWRTDYPHCEHRHPSTEAELWAAIREGLAGGYCPWISCSNADSILYARQIKRSNEYGKKRYERAKARKKGYAVTIDCNYLFKATPRRFILCGGVKEAHIYATLASAEKVRDRIIRCKYTSKIVEVERDENGKWKEAA
ncbi:hypothetical protein [uncultured Prevotella sp.]|uniref:hypothetical protein n=1 Tax=uncultured Prevotella sp. TaxID=159272 RepID=UPI0026012767|nr:hypothetical protein [uncultured Prevotella sp.]